MRLQKELERGGFDAKFSDDIIGTMWEKWFFLATLVGSTCLMRATVGEIMRTAEGENFISRMLAECSAVEAAWSPAAARCPGECAGDADGSPIEYFGVDAARYPARG